jgi:protein-S-isoprenylcysteine O-methyltransferase Ste14
MDWWFVDPLAPRQILSWAFLITSLVLIYLGVQMFRQRGKLDSNRTDPALVGIEKTTELVTSGVYKTIRHPFYSSLLFLAWGILLKQITWLGVLLALIATVFLVLTARKEEDENIGYFGEKYRAYMQRTRMFVPYLF